MTLPGLAIVSVSPSTSTLCPPSRSASVVHPALLVSPRYAELTSATSAGTSAVVAGRVIKPRPPLSNARRDYPCLTLDRFRAAVARREVEADQNRSRFASRSLSNGATGRSAQNRDVPNDNSC